MKRNNNIKTEEQQEIKKFVIITLVLVLVIFGIYLLTDKFVDKSDYSNTIPGSINYNKASIGTMLNRNEADYYVMIFDSKKSEATYYSSIVTKYQNNENAKKVYFVDLNNKINAKYYNVNDDNKSNPKAKNIKELDLADVTLIQVKDGKINLYVEKIDEIANILK